MKNIKKAKGPVSLKASQGGFTLIEILVVIGIIAVLAAIVIIAINPARQFAQARNSQRTSNTNSILNAIGQNIADNKGIFNCAPIDATARTISKGTGATITDLRPCLVPTYMSEMSYDPQTGNNTCESAIACSTGSYDTKYTVIKDATSGRITVTAIDTELVTPDISVTR